MTPAIFTCLRSQFPSVVSGTISSRGLERTAVSRAQLGFHDWEAGPDYARLGWRGVVGEGVVDSVFFSSRPSQGF